MLPPAGNLSAFLAGGFLGCLSLLKGWTGLLVSSPVTLPAVESHLTIGFQDGPGSNESSEPSIDSRKHLSDEGI